MESSPLSEGAEIPDETDSEKFVNNGVSLFAVVWTSDEIGIKDVAPNIENTNVVIDDGKYAIVSSYMIEGNSSRTRGTALQAEVMEGKDGYLKDKEVSITQIDRREGENYGAQYVYSNSEVTVWTFESTGTPGEYYVSVDTEEGTRYLNVNGDSLSLAEEKQVLTLVQSEKTNLYYLRNADGYQISLSGDAMGNGFHACYARQNPSDHIMLCALMDTPAPSRYADKLSVSDTVAGERYVIYTKIDGEFYAVSSENTLVKVYDEGTRIGWRAKDEELNNLLWKLDYYSDPDEKNGNQCYAGLLNAGANGQYLTPLSEWVYIPNDKEDDIDDGVVLEGKDAGEYSTLIRAWDSSANNGTGAAFTLGYEQNADGDYILVSDSHNWNDEDKNIQFMFARYTTKSDDETTEPTEVETVDSKSMGVKITMFDYKDGNEINGGSAGANGQNTQWRTGEQAALLGDMTAAPFEQGIVESVLTNGYPVITNEYGIGNLNNAQYDRTFGASLDKLFSGGQEANHLFLKSVYDATGYMSFSSFENYAVLQESGDFKVYEELGAPVQIITGQEQKYMFALTRGNFMPYNDITTISKDNFVNYNLHDEDGNPLAPDNPRFGEVLYAIEEPNYLFGMKIEATFYQTRYGTTDGTENGESTVYRFNGDDDLWIFIDNALVLDVGGISDAHSGEINFQTGAISYEVEPADTKAPHTIKEAFEKAGILPDGKQTKWPVEGADASAYTALLGSDNSEILTKEQVESIIDYYFSGETFRDYSAHEFKMFYMERGAGASNLKMEMNISFVPPAEFYVEKQISGTEIKDKYTDKEYAFKAYIKDTADINFREVTSKDYGVYTKGQRIGKPVEFGEDNIFYLKEGEAVKFVVSNNLVKYYVEEVKISEADTAAFDTFFNCYAVSKNGIYGKGEDGYWPEEYKSELYKWGEDEEGNQLYAVRSMTLVADSGKTISAIDGGQVIVQNHLLVDNAYWNLKELVIEKKLKGSSGKEEVRYPDSNSPTYSYRVRLGDRAENIKLYSDAFYLVKDGYYYKKVNGLPVKTEIRYSDSSFDIPVYDNVSDDGIISGIPAGFSVVIRGIVPGTYFTVEEVNLPDESEHVSTVMDSNWKWNDADEENYNAAEVSDALKEEYKNLEYGVIGQIISGNGKNNGAHITVTNACYKSTDGDEGQETPQNSDESGSDDLQNDSDNPQNNGDGIWKLPITGDASDIVLWIEILLVSAALQGGRKYGKEQKK